MIINKKINNSILYYHDKSDPYFSMIPISYYYFVKSRLERVIEKIDKTISVSLGRTEIDSDINIDIQFEHAIYRNEKNEPYYPLFHNYNRIQNNNIIIEYSATNYEICNLHKLEIDFIDKLIYIPPLIYDTPILNNNNRYKNVVTLHSMNERRGIIHEQYKIDSVGSFDDEVISKTYQNYKILMNVHQSDKFLTIEELRILPALMNGILIISETGPFYDKIPYHEHIIWSEYESLIDTTKNVTQNYEVFKAKHQNNLSHTLNMLSEKINSDLQQKIEKILS